MARRGALLALGVLSLCLCGCVTSGATYTRLDGEPILADAPSGQQFYIDQATCKSQALSAANSVVSEPQQQMTQSQSQQMNVYADQQTNLGVPAPNYHAQDWSWIGNASSDANTSAQMLTAAMDGCMAQKGYARSQ